MAAAAPHAGPWIPQLYQVARVRRELPDTTTLELAPVAGPRPSFAPGQFNMLYAFGVGEAAIAPLTAPTSRTVWTKCSASAALKAGATIGVRGPFGSSWPLESAQGADVLFVAGGLGLAPLSPAIYHVLANRPRYGRVVILFGSRNPRDMLYRRELERWRQRLDVDIEVTVDHANADWHGNVGVVPALIRRAAFDPHDTVAMICGPEVMMRFTVNALLEAGVSPQQIHLSMERNMKCAVGLCGHCQFGAAFVCKDGPVMRYDRIADIFAVREI